MKINSTYYHFIQSVSFFVQLTVWDTNTTYVIINDREDKTNVWDFCLKNNCKWLTAHENSRLVKVRQIELCLLDFIQVKKEVIM